MANRKTSRRPAPRPATASDARRLGAQNGRPAQSQGAQRRAARAQRRRTSRISFLAIGVVVIVAVVLIVVNVTGGSKPSGSSNSGAGVTSGQDPVLASVSKMVNPVTTIPLSVYNSVGTNSDPLPFTVTKGQPPLTKNKLPEFVYEGAEFCPYCAATRWAMVAALSRFGTFTDLKMTSSADTDGNIPTFSFLGSTYTSKYVAFTPWEQTDRDQKPLQTVPNSYSALYTKYDGSDATNAAAAPFNPGQSAGIPFVDIDNKYVESGAPGSLNATIQALYGGGPEQNTASSAAAIAAALHDPTGSVASAIGAKSEIAVANYYTAGICSVDGNMPSPVCTSSGVKAAAKAIAASKPVS